MSTGIGTDRLSDEAIVLLCVEFLNKRGYNVVYQPEYNEWYPCAHLAKRYNLSSAGFWRRIHHTACPAFDSEQSASGQISAIRLNPMLDKFLSMPKQPGAKSLYAAFQKIKHNE